MNFKHLKQFMYDNRKKYLTGVFVLLAVDALQLLTPMVLGRFTDALYDGTLTTSQIPYYMAAVILIAMGVASGRYCWRMLIIGTSKRMEYHLRTRLFDHLETMSTDYYNHHKTGDLMAHATNDIQTIRQSFGPGSVLVIDALFMGIMTIILMVTQIDITLTLVALIPLPLIAFIMLFLGRIIRTRFENVQKAFSDLSDKAQEAFSGIRIIKSFVQEKFELYGFNEINEKNYQTNMHLIKVSGILFPLVSLIATFSSVIAIVLGGSMVINGSLSIGQLVTFLSFLGMLTWPMMALGMVFNILERGKVSLQRINTLLDTPPELLSRADAMTLYSQEAHLQIKDLTFTYKGQSHPALSDINMTIHSGQTVAIVGKTGSGKTTLLNLLLHLYNVEDGHIFINQKDINDITIKSLRDHIGYVPQDHFLFSTTIEENIAFSNPQMAFSQVEAAAKLASVDGEILSFKDGYNTLLGERGVNMSGGQKQRVSIARALAKSPDLLIFDDSLSAVDTKTEEHILHHLNVALKDKTAIIVAHRISTIKDADQIFVLEDGKITQTGQHETLANQPGLYRSLYQKQLLQEKIIEQ